MMTEEEKQDYRGLRFITTDTVHLLNKGRTFCEMEGVPAEWPEDHRWTGPDHPEHVNCIICLAVNNNEKTSGSAYREVLKIVDELNKGITSADPRLRKSVKIRHEEMTTLYYRYAFVEKLCSWYIIFTEHHGTHIYHTSDAWVIQMEEVEIDSIDATAEPDKYVRCKECGGSGFIWRKDHFGNRSGGSGCDHCDGVGKVRVT